MLAFGTRSWDEAPTLTRARSVWLGEGWVVLAGDEDHPWTREVAAGPPELPDAPSPRPPSIVNVADLEADRDEVPPGTSRDWRDLGRAVGSERTGMRHVRVEPGRLNAQHHCHSAEEEIFVVLEGEGTLELVPAPTLARARRSSRSPSARATSSPVRPARASRTRSAPARRA